MNPVWHLIGLLACALLFCPLKWLFRPARLLCQVLWTIIIAVGHQLGQSLRLLSLTIAVGLSLPLLYSSLTPLVSSHPALPHFWVYVWVIIVVVLRLALLPAILIEWSAIRPWEQEIARSASTLNTREESTGWLLAISEIKASLPRIWKISGAISNTRVNEFHQWGVVARCSGLLMTHLFLLTPPAQLSATESLEQPHSVNFIFMIIIIAYLIKYSLSSSRHKGVTVALLSLLISTVYFSHTYVSMEDSAQVLGVSVFFIFSVLLGGLALQQLISFSIKTYVAHAHLVPFGSGQWQFQLINQFSKVGKIAAKHSNIFIFLHLLDALAAILKITVT